MSAPKAVLFDLDGTLTDRPASLREAARRLVAAYPTLGKRSFDQVSEALILADDNGMRPRLDMMARWIAALESIDPPPQDELLRWWADHFGDCTVAAPGLREVLAACTARELALGLVTNGGGRTQRQKLEKLGIAGRFGVTLISEEVGIRKPDPRLFRMALAGVAAQAAETWMVGDNADADIAGAQLLGIRGLWLAHGRPWPGAVGTPERTIASLHDVVKLLG